MTKAQQILLTVVTLAVIWFSNLVIRPMIREERSPAAMGGKIIQKNLNSPSSYKYVSGDVLWQGHNKKGNEAYVVRVAYDAQNGFGATMRGCSLVAFSKASNGELEWSSLYGVTEPPSQIFCDESIDKSKLSDLARGLAESSLLNN